MVPHETYFDHTRTRGRVPMRGLGSSRHLPGTRHPFGQLSPASADGSALVIGLIAFSRPSASRSPIRSLKGLFLDL